MLRGKAAVSTEDDVDDIFWVLEIFGPRLIALIIILLILPLAVLIREWSVECLVEADTLEERMLGLRVHRALLVQDFLKLILIVPRLLASRIALNSRDFMV
jgi:hypothetical protein